MSVVELYSCVVFKCVSPFGCEGSNVRWNPSVSKLRPRIIHKTSIETSNKSTRQCSEKHQPQGSMGKLSQASNFVIMHKVDSVEA